MNTLADTMEGRNTLADNLKVRNTLTKTLGGGTHL